MNRSFLSVVLTVLLSCACHSTNSVNQADNSVPTNEEAFPIFGADVNLAKPLEISKSPKDAALCEKINQTIEASELANARWGVIAIGLNDGRIVCGREERKLFNPASIQKILTAIVALDKLGADYRWKTSIYATQTVQDGTLDGDLTIYGRGAPDFDENSLENLIAQLQAKGLKRITGNIVGDDSYFKGDSIGDGWTWNDLQWYYGAEASALSYNKNELDVYMQDGKPVASSDYLEIESDLQPKQADRTEAYGIKRGLADNRIYIWGNGEKASGRMSVSNPARWTAKLFRDALEKKGITVEGDVKSGNWQSKDKLNVETGIELAAVESVTLAEVVNKMNKRSVNIYAELMLRTLGRNFGDSAPAETKQIQEVRGDDAAGTSVIKKFLTENKVLTEEIRIHDGSGLSRLDFVTPEAFGRALVYAAQSKFADVFTNSLPIAGTDGTLSGRLGKVKGKIYAKTGSINYVSSLAGYALTAEGEVLAFSITVNNATKKNDGANLIDVIATAFVDTNSGVK